MQPQLLNYDLGHGVVAFSTMRSGGYSIGNYADFNINRYCGDSDNAIHKNSLALCAELSISPDNLLMPHQVHLQPRNSQHECLAQSGQQYALDKNDKPVAS